MNLKFRCQLISGVEEDLKEVKIREKEVFKSRQKRNTLMRARRFRKREEEEDLKGPKTLKSNS